MSLVILSMGDADGLVRCHGFADAVVVTIERREVRGRRELDNEKDVVGVLIFPRYEFKLVGISKNRTWCLAYSV